MRALVRTSILVLSLCAPTFLPGCIVAAAAAGAAGAAYVAGDLEARLDARPDRVVAASEQALQAMDIHVVSADATEVDGKVVGRTALDKKVQITVEKRGEKSSKVWIRVDTFGDEALSRQILEKIQSKL